MRVSRRDPVLTCPLQIRVHLQYLRHPVAQRQPLLLPIHMSRGCRSGGMPLVGPRGSEAGAPHAGAECNGQDGQATSSTETLTSSRTVKMLQSPITERLEVVQHCQNAMRRTRAKAVEGR